MKDLCIPIFYADLTAPPTKYRIELKRDFPECGYLINGKWIRKGFVVTRGGANILPGAAWCSTIADCFRAIAMIEEVGSGPEFWKAVPRYFPAR